MSTVTVIKYDVLEVILRDWLWKEFGTDATYEVRKKATSHLPSSGTDFEQPASESGAGYWKVTATREISQVCFPVQKSSF